MVLYVVRHGETEFNVQKRYAGKTDIPLNENGMKQAQELAEKLANQHLDVIISSPLIRARTTAERIAEYHRNISVRIMDEFAEVCVGVYEGLTREEAQEKYPELWARKCTRQVDDAPTGGETIRQCDKRVADGIEKVKALYHEKTVLIVCHGFISRAINRQMKGLTFEEMHNFSLGNCEVIKYSL